MDLVASLKFVRAYMGDLLIIRRGKLDEHLQKNGDSAKQIA